MKEDVLEQIVEDYLENQMLSIFEQLCDGGVWP